MKKDLVIYQTFDEEQGGIIMNSNDRDEIMDFTVYGIITVAVLLIIGSVAKIVIGISGGIL